MIPIINKYFIIQVSIKQEQWVALPHMLMNHFLEVPSCFKTVVIPVDVSQINNFVDELPLIVLQKLNEKFNNYCNKSSQLTLDQFIILHLYPYKQASDGKFPIKSSKNGEQNQEFILKTKQQSEALLIRLYYFYTDMEKNKLRFKNFIGKYSIISKSSEDLLAQIMYFINVSIDTKETALKNKQNHPIMTVKQFNSFLENNAKYFDFSPQKIADRDVNEPIKNNQFADKLKQHGFDYDSYRKKFILFNKEDFPFEEISRKLIEMDISDYNTGQIYYIISSKWFQQWSFYYEGSADFMSSQNYKSTKLIKNPKKSDLKKRKRKSVVQNSFSHRDIDLDDNIWLAEKPTTINFDDIEGQFYGELKENIRANYEIKVISLEIWEMFKKTMKSQSQIWRIASSPTVLEYYPKMIYFLSTNKDGSIDDKSFQIVQASLKTKLSEIYSHLDKNKKQEAQERTQRYYYFIKNFGEDKWLQEDRERALGRCSTETRFFVVQTTSKAGFLEKYTRKEQDTTNITYGDKVFAYFAYKKQLMPAYILRNPQLNKFKVHFLDFSYKYEVQVNTPEISIQEQLCSTLSDTLRRSIDTFSYKGIKNIGNTCFINAIIQCLIATPIFDDYITNHTFNNKTQPLLYQISLIAKDLLTHQKVSPIELKKTIDMQLQIFSGNDQHDAQEFLGFLLDKFSNELKTQVKKEVSSDDNINIIDELFGGTTMNTLICKKCQNISQSGERISIVSLPIPQPQFNTFVIYIFPVYYNKIRKVILRLHHTATLNQYLNNLEERTGQSASDFLFVESSSVPGRKVRKDFLDEQYSKTKLQQIFVQTRDLGITPNIEIFAYEHIQNSTIQEISIQNRNNRAINPYFDFFDENENKWIYGKYVDIQSKKKIEVMEIQQPFKISTIKFKSAMTDNIAPLGDKTKQTVFKKLYMRKYNTALKKMENFGFSLMVSYPKVVTYNQLCKLINIHLQNFVSLRKSNDRPYYIRIIEMNNPKCLFCGKADLKYEDQLKNCCKPIEKEKNAPLFWLSSETNYVIYIEWFNFNAYNMEFSSIIQVDPLSLAVQKQKNNDKIHVQECLKLLQKPQTVQMQCDKCKHWEQQRKQTMKNVPNILILHMKQFRVTAQQTLIKLDVNLKWIQYLDISNFSTNSKGCIYELYAYVRHTGTSNSGHYTCVTRRKHLFENKKTWVKFDDEITETVDQQQKNIDSAYLLFFKKVDIPNSTYLNFSSFQSV